MTEEFWTSEKGVMIRLEDLAHDFSFRIYNGALQGFFKGAGFKKFMWVSVLGPNTCKYCEGQHGKEYRSGQFLPRVPAHVKCQCFWDILIGM